MDRYGGNLPAVVDMITKHHPRIWAKILDVMRQLLPGLSEIQVDYTHSRTLGLYFHEDGVGRPWTVAEVSDGTIHSLALLVAFYDPRAAMLVLEEPENSVHTWILRMLMEAAAEAAQSKQIVLTTHSESSLTPGDPMMLGHVENCGQSNLLALERLNRLGIGLIAVGSLISQFSFPNPARRIGRAPSWSFPLAAAPFADRRKGGPPPRSPAAGGTSARRGDGFRP
jgi:predicted ATPase